MDAWDTVVNGRFQPQVVANGVAQDKPKADWSDDDKKKVQYDLKAHNILIFSRGLMSIILSLIVRPIKICGMHWKSFMKESMMLNNKKLIPLCNNMRFFACKMVKPSPPCK